MMMHTDLLLLVVPLVFCILAVMFLRPIARRHGLVDKPDKRKLHKGEHPLVGGIAMYTALLIACVFSGNFIDNLAFFIAGFALVTIGAYDDYKATRARSRFLVQILASLLMIYGGGVLILQVGDIVGSGVVYLPSFLTVIFTVFCTVGVINAVNMSDGLDGLAGSQNLVSVAALALLAWAGGRWEELQILLMLSAAILAFLWFNLRIFGKKSASIFMGDAGSMFIGFTLTWYLIALSQGDNSVLSAVSAGWILGIPLMDTVGVMIRRILHRQSPFQADRGHLHHILLRTGMSVNHTVATIVTAHSILVICGLLINTYAEFEPMGFISFVFLTVGYAIYNYHANSELDERPQRSRHTHHEAVHEGMDHPHALDALDATSGFKNR